MDRDERKELIRDFLRKCNNYAEGKLAECSMEAAASTGMAALRLQDEICHWTAYKAFNEHAITELEDGRLDHWFD
jgi:hypothetical protein